VAENCYNAPLVQRAFMEASEKFKGLVIRFSRRRSHSKINSSSNNNTSNVTTKSNTSVLHEVIEYILVY
jgi:hypothetical protein